MQIKPSSSTVSHTAAAVAAYRSRFDRVETAFGDPDADDSLTMDVAAGVDVAHGSRMGGYLAGRTRFFDRVVIGALERGVRQFVSVGAGYDGRAWRYAVAGARWWELDRNQTQADKRARLERLSIDCTAVTFLPVDLESSPQLAEALVDSGFDPVAPALFVLEGVLVYLTRQAIDALLTELRRLATPGTRAALSIGAGASRGTRDSFEATVAAAGEPASNDLSESEFDAALDRCRWARRQHSNRATAAGLIVARPLFRPLTEHDACSPRPLGTLGFVGSYLDHSLARRGTDRLGEHLSERHGIAVSAVTELDVGVFRVELPERERWIARVSPVGRPVSEVHGDAEFLRELDRSGFPAERVAVADPVSDLEGQGVLVTRLLPGRPAAARAESFEQLGALLAQLHTLAVTPRRPGGGWHHLIGEGTAADELDAARELLYASRHRVPADERADFESLLAAFDAVNLQPVAPAALVHADLVPRNALADRRGQLTVIDWAGAGAGSRVAAFGALLWAAASSLAASACVDGAVRGYMQACELNAAELDQLQSAVDLRPLTLASWSFATGRGPLSDAVRSWRHHHAANNRAVARVHTALEQRAGS